MRFSASRLKKWSNCPLQAHFAYDLKLPVEGSNAKAVFGSCIHQALDGYNRTGDLDQALALFNDLWENPEKVGAPVHTLIWPRQTSYGSLKDRGNAVLRDTAERIRLEKRVVIASEHEFLVPFGRHELHGFVDLMEVRQTGRGKNIVKVVDWKTNARQPNFADLYLDIQFTVYMYASLQPEFWFGNGPEFPPVENADWVYEMYFNLPRRAIWYQLWTQKEIDAGPRDDEDYFRLYRLCDSIQRATEAEVWVPKIGDACTFCDFKEPCGITIPTREEIAEQDEAWI